MPPSWISSPGAPPGRRCVLAAPLAEITDSAFRALCLECGADGATTEMACAAGIVRGSAASFALLSRLGSERGPCSAQLYGHDPAELGAAAKTVAETGAFDAIDLNAGCPMKRITANGDGAALMGDVALFGRCVEAMAKASAPLPLTVKTRVGLVPEKPIAALLARTAESAGAAAIVVHGRFASQIHAGAVAADEIAAAVAAVRIPVVANGGVKSARDAVALADETGAAGVMVGRGAVGNPWIFGDIRAAFDGGPAPAGGPERTDEEVFEMFRRHVGLLREAKEAAARIRGAALSREEKEAAVALDARRHLLCYFKGRRGASALRRAAGAARSAEEIFAAVAAAGYGSLESATESSPSVGI